MRYCTLKRSLQINIHLGVIFFRFLHFSAQSLDDVSEAQNLCLSGFEVRADGGRSALQLCPGPQYFGLVLLRLLADGTTFRSSRIKLLEKKLVLLLESPVVVGVLQVPERGICISDSLKQIYIYSISQWYITK